MDLFDGEETGQSGGEKNRLKTTGILLGCFYMGLWRFTPDALRSEV
jgi:hypothetical protein